jgi:hypothetical protein
MSHGSLSNARSDVRRNVNTGEGFQETHGLHDKFGKRFHAAVTRGYHVPLTGIQIVSEKNCASVQFSPILCPAWVYGERHAVHCRALPCDNCQMGHSATVRSSHHRTTGAPQTSQRRTTWATVTSGSLRTDAPQVHNLLTSYLKIFYGPKGQLYTKENESL